MNTYHAFYRGKKLELKAETTYKAQQEAVKLFKAKKAFEITIMLVAKGEEPYTHSTTEI